MAATYRTTQIAAEASAYKAQLAHNVPECHETALLSTDDTLFSIFK